MHRDCQAMAGWDGAIVAIYSVCVTDGLEVLQYVAAGKRTASRQDVSR